jgi:hypothetical protein
VECGFEQELASVDLELALALLDDRAGRRSA